MKLGFKPPKKPRSIVEHSHPHRHDVVLPNDVEVMTSKEIDFDDMMEEELGIAAAAVPVVAAGGKILGDVGEKLGEELVDVIFGDHGPKLTGEITDPYAAMANMMQGAPMTAGGYPSGGAGGLSAQEVQYIVKDLLTQLPPHVRSQMKNALVESKAADLSSRDLQRVIADKVNSEFMPKINELMGAMKMGNVQTEATNEHRKIVNSENRWKQNHQAQQQLMNKLRVLDKKFTNLTGK